MAVITVRLPLSLNITTSERVRLSGCYRVATIGSAVLFPSGNESAITHMV